MLAPLVLWLFLLVMSGLIGLPLARYLLPRHPDLGHGVGHVLALVAFGLPVLLVNGSGLFGRTPPLLGSVLLIILLFSGWAAWRQGEPLRAELRRTWRQIALTELIILGAFALSLAPLLFTDTSQFGERAMDLAFLTELTRADGFPPENPYLAGQALNYHYFGHLLFSLPTRLLGLDPVDSYFMATATVAALAVGCLWSLVGRFVTSLWARGVGVMLVAGMTNLAYLSGGLGNAQAWLSSNWLVGNAINEYPLYTFLVAELHAHAIAVPIFVATIALALALADAFHGPGSGALAATGAAVAVTLGALGPTSSWAFLTAALVATLIVGLDGLSPRPSDGRMRVSLGVGLAIWVAVVAAAWLLYLPYYWSLRPLPAWPAFVAGLTSEPRGFLLHWGPFLWLLLGSTLVGSRLVQSERALPSRVVTVVAVTAVAIIAVHGVLVPGPAYSVAFAVATSATAIALAQLLRFRGEKRMDIAMLLTTLGWALVAFCELVYFNDAHSGGLERATTVFKFYLHAWILLGLGGSMLLFRLIETCRTAQTTARVVAGAVMAPLFVHLGASLVFTYAGLGAKTEHWKSGPHLSAIHFMEARDPGYAAALSWLRSDGTADAVRPVVAEWVDPDRNTNWLGVPTAASAYLAWPEQLLQWNYPVDTLRARRAIIERIYRMPTGRDACALMTVEGIDLIYFGRKELQRFGPRARSKLTRPPFRTVFERHDAAVFTCTP